MQFPVFFDFHKKEEENMLKMLLSVIRAVIVELVDQLLRRVCTMAG